MKQATLISDNLELNGELVQVVEEDYQPGQALVTLVAERVSFLWPVNKLVLT